MLLSGWSALKTVQPAYVRIHLRIPDQCEGNLTIPGKNARSSVFLQNLNSVHDWRVEAHGDCSRPGPCRLVPFRLGQRQHTHTHTVSICNSIAPHGRARPRAVTQMALGDLHMTYLP